MTLIFPLVILFSCSNKELDTSVLEGSWYYCEANGEYGEFTFDNNQFIHTHSTGKLMGVYEIRGDSIKFMAERYHTWNFVLLIQNNSKSGLLTKFVDLAWPEEKYQKQIYLQKLTLQDVESNYEIRRKSIGCMDTRSFEQKLSDSLTHLQSDKGIMELEEKLDSLSNEN